MLLLIAALFWGCLAGAGEGAPDGAEPEGQGPGDQAKVALTPVSVQLQWRHQWQFAGFYAALAQGYYADAGLAVELREHREGVDIIAEVLAGRADFGTYYSTLIAERMRGRPIVLLASYFKRSPLVLLVRPDLYFPNDLKGLRVMADPQELASANLLQMLKRFGLTASDIRVVPHSLTVEPFVRGEVDAMTAFSTNEPFLLRKRGVSFNVINPGDYGVQLYDLNLFTSDAYAVAHPERVRAFVAATNRGWDYALAHPENLTDLILSRYNTQGIERDHLRFEAIQTHSVILPEIYPVGSIDPAQIDRIQDLFIETGFAQERVPTPDLVFGLKPLSLALVGGLDRAETWPATGAPQAVQGHHPPGIAAVDDPRREHSKDDIVAALRPRVQLTDAERAEIAAHPDVVLGVDPEWPPMIVTNPDGSLSGIDVDTAALIDRLIGTRIRFETGPWADEVGRAQRGDIDGLSSSAANRERADSFRFTVPYTEVGKSIFVRSGNPERLHRLEDLAGRRVAYRRGNLADAKTLRAIPGAPAVPVDTHAAAVNKLLSGEVDAILASDPFLRWLMERNVGGVETGFVLPTALPLVFSIRKDRPLLVSAIDKVLTAMSREQRMAIRERYIAGVNGPLSHRPPMLNDTEREYLRAKGGALTYCFSPSWAPHDYLEDGVHKGTFQDYMDLFTRKLGIEFKPLPSRTWAEALQSAQERRCDFLPGAAQTPERESYLAFTTPYIRLTHVLVAREEAPFVPGIESLPGKPIGMTNGTAIAAQLKARFPRQPWVEFDNINQFADGIRSGRVYAAVATLEHAADLVEQGMGRFRIIGKLDAPYPISVAVRNDEPELLGIMQKAVDATTPAEHDRIRQRQTTFKIEQNPDLSRFWQVLGVLVALGLFLGYRQWELTRLNLRLTRARDAAEVASRAKDAFLANMSHEIRTPLNAVLNLAALGARSREPERLRSYLAEIERSGRSLLEVVNEILDFSRLEGGADILRSDRFELMDLTNRVLSIAAPLAADKGLRLECSIEPDLDGRWSGDAHKIERVLVNLVGNAVKFTDQGGVTLRVDTAGTLDGRALVRFEVRDTGIGIAQSQLPDLFEPFHQGDTSLSRRHGGSGLGLAIVKRLAELMGGEISAWSRPGEGSRFSMVIPLERGPAAESADGQEPSVVPAGLGQPQSAGHAGPAAAAMRPDLPDGARPRVLVVEDNIVNQQIVVELLSQLGVAAETVPDGETALARLALAPQGFNLVLMDVQMPGLDGYETTRRLRADPRLHDLPVIAITAHVLASDQQRCLDAGMNDHIPKPFDQAAFAATLARWMRLPAITTATGEQARLEPLAALPEMDVLDAAPSRRWINPAVGVRRVGGDQGLYLTLLNDFIASYAPCLEVLGDTAADQSRDEVARVAHMLRGTAPMLGAARLAELAVTADDRVKQGEPLAPAFITDLRAALRQTLEAARSIRAGGLPGLIQQVHQPPAATQDEALSSAPIERADVLIVDDDPFAAGLLARLLAEEHAVAVADNGDEALAKARGQPRPDLILLDVVMDGIDGYQVCRELKADPATRDIPVIFVSGRGRAEDERYGLELGAVDYVHKPFEREVVRARVRNHLAAKRQGDSLTRLSQSDGLTGLANRRRLDAYLAEQWQLAMTQDESLGLLMIDIDQFKAYNDRYGHAAGDDCLRQVASTLRENCAPETCLVARYGGEEFVCVLPGADLAAARLIAESALEAVRRLAIPHEASPGRPIVTLSIGVWAGRPRPGDQPGDFLTEADRRLYRAKSEGRDRCVS